MIRLGTMTSVCPDWSIEQIIDGMQRHGFEGLEPRAGWRHASGFELDMPAAARDAARAKIEDAGLKISCVATGAKFAAEDPADLDKLHRRGQRCNRSRGRSGCRIDSHIWRRAR